MKPEEIQNAVEAIYNKAVEYRRALHRSPEIGMECKETQKFICNVLEENGIEYRALEVSGVIASIQGTAGKSEKCVMLRADHDALRVEEKTGLDYQSEIPGRMHACGHDLHTAMLLCAAIILKENASAFAGEVRLLFQPGEEISEGALYMIENGALDGVDIGMGIHADPLLPSGTISARSGADWAGVDRYHINISGVQAHGATPHKGKDPVVCACALVNALQTIVSRRIDPLQPVVVTVGQIHAGSAYNIIPETAFLEGTCRTFSAEVQKSLPGIFEEIATNVAAAYGCKAEVVFDNTAGPLVNDNQAFGLFCESAQKVLTRAEITSREPEMIGEDFAEFAERVPCIFAHLGCDGGAPLHSPYVNFKEEAMKTGIALEVQFALDALK